MMFWTNILVLVCPCQKWLSPNVSNSSEITQASLVGSISVRFRGLLPILGPQEGSKAISRPHLGVSNNFPHFFLMNNSIEHSGLYSMNIFLNKYFWFCFELNHFSARINEKMNFQNVSPTPPHVHGWNFNLANYEILFVNCWNNCLLFAECSADGFVQLYLMPEIKFQTGATINCN